MKRHSHFRRRNRRQSEIENCNGRWFYWCHRGRVQRSSSKYYSVPNPNRTRHWVQNVPISTRPRTSQRTIVRSPHRRRQPPSRIARSPVPRHGVSEDVRRERETTYASRFVRALPPVHILLIIFFEGSSNLGGVGSRRENASVVVRRNTRLKGLGRFKAHTRRFVTGGEYLSMQA